MGNAEAISYFAYGWKFWLNVLFCSVLVGWQRTLDPQLPKVSTDLGTPRRYIVLEKPEKGGSVSFKCKQDLLYQLLNRVKDFDTIVNQKKDLYTIVA
jgi:hypothetical protein